MTRRGLTLIEVLVAAVLTMVVLGSAWETMHQGMRLWSCDLGHGSLQAQALVLESRLTRELAATTSDSVSADAQGLAFLLPSGSFDPDNGLPVWHRFAVYRLSGRTLTRVEVGHPQLPSTSALVLTPPQRAAAGGGRVVLRDVQRFEVSLTGSLCTVDLELSNREGRASRHLCVALQKVEP